MLTAGHEELDGACPPGVLPSQPEGGGCGPERSEPRAPFLAGQGQCCPQPCVPFPASPSIRRRFLRAPKPVVLVMPGDGAEELAVQQPLVRPSSETGDDHAACQPCGARQYSLNSAWFLHRSRLQQLRKQGVEALCSAADRLAGPRRLLGCFCPSGSSGELQTVPVNSPVTTPFTKLVWQSHSMLKSQALLHHKMVLHTTAGRAAKSGHAHTRYARVQGEVFVVKCCGSS